MKLKRMLVGAVAVASAVTMAGCGTATNVSSSGATLTKASFASAVTTSVSHAKSVHMVGLVTVQGQAVHLTEDMSMAGRDASEPLMQQMRHAKMAMTMAMPGGKSVEIRLVNGVVYVNAAQMGLPSAKPWVKIDLTDPSNPLGQMLHKLAGSMDPAQLAQTFRSMSKLTKVGPATVDGVSTTHYLVTIDTSKMASVLNLPASALAKFPKSITENVWLDSSSRPVKIDMNIRQMAVTMNFSRWGEPVAVTAPPASQVSELPLGH